MEQLWLYITQLALSGRVFIFMGELTHYDLRHTCVGFS